MSLLDGIFGPGFASGVFGFRQGMLGAVLTPGHPAGCSCGDCWAVFRGWKRPPPGIYWTRTGGNSWRVEVVR